MLSPVFTENSAGIPLHAYLSSIQSGGGDGGAPYLQMISKNMVVPIGLSVTNHMSDLESGWTSPETDLDALKEIPDSLFDQCLGMVSLNKKRTKQTSRKPQVKKKRASKRSWF